MHWQTACSKSSNLKAKRIDFINNRKVYRDICGEAYYCKQGEHIRLPASRVEGYLDWEPDSPIEEKQV